MKSVIGLSGGMDSTTLLALLLDDGADVICCNFQYGAKHNSYEQTAFADIINYYQNIGMSVSGHIVNLAPVFSLLQSNLLVSGGDIPEGHYNDDDMKKTVVPGRNLIFSSVLAALAESSGVGRVYLGVHSGDHHIYPDCRPKFINKLRDTVYQSTEGAVEIVTPLIKEDKTSILKLGYSLDIKVPYGLTRTCYKNQVNSCGKCGACRERLEAFENINKADPINYE